MKADNKTYMLLALAVIFWGIQPLCVKIIIREWSPAALTCLRYTCITVTLFLIMYVKKERQIMPPSHLWPLLVLMGLTGVAINNVAQFTGLGYSTITNCTLIASTGPAVTALLAAIFIHERLNLIQWLGIIISLCGVVFLISGGSADIFRQLSVNKGDILFFTCQLVWAGYSLMGLKVMQEISALAATAWSGLFGTIFVAGYGLCTDGLKFSLLSLPAVYSFLFAVFLGGVGAMVFWNIGVKNAGPSMAAIFSNLTPLVGMLCGAVMLNEAVGLVQLAGATTIFTGIFLTTHSGKAAGWFSGRRAVRD